MGKTDDLFLETATGDVYQKGLSGWNPVTNLLGPIGSQGLAVPKVMSVRKAQQVFRAQQDRLDKRETPALRTARSDRLDRCCRPARFPRIDRRNRAAGA